MNWYKIHKYSAPYGLIKCPKCKSKFILDFGFVDTKNDRSSTLYKGENPFSNIEHKEYDNFNLDVKFDDIERGTIITQCDECFQYFEVEYEDNPAEYDDYLGLFSRTKITDIQPISEELAEGYKNIGMPKSPAIKS